VLLQKFLTQEMEEGGIILIAFKTSKKGAAFLA